jgi:surfactin synthase thioesterase subunit
VSDADEWIIRFVPTPRAPVRLVCFPHAGGSASFFFPLVHTLGAKAAADAAKDTNTGTGTADAEILAVQYPGRQNRRHEPCVDDVHALADAVATALSPHLQRADRPDPRPLALFGHSMGAVVAFETARRLQERGQAPAVLFASGRPAPSCRRTDAVHLRDDQGVLDEIRTVGGTDTRVLDNPEILASVLPALRADYRAVETYRAAPGATVTCPIAAMTGDADPRVSVTEARAWAEHTTGGFSLRVLPGGHFYLAERSVEATEAIRTTLRRVLAEAQPQTENSAPSNPDHRTPADDGDDLRSDGFLTRSGN